MKTAQLLGALFEKHQSDLRRLIAHKFKKSHHEAEDIVQDAFYNILRAENIESLENPKAYLYQAASNLALNRIRKNRHHSAYVAKLNLDEIDELDERTPERSVLAYKDLKKLQQSIQQPCIQ